jgi:hydroxyacylglutathione hydrolase
VNIAAKDLGEWAGWLVDYKRPLYLVISKTELEGAVKLLAKIGIEQVAAYFDAEEVMAAGLATEAYRTARPEELAEQILNGEVELLDVRAQTEWDAGRLPNARHVMLGYLPERAQEIVRESNRPIVLQCRTGRRSGIAASILQKAGANTVINMVGGYREWAKAGMPIERDNSGKK